MELEALNSDKVEIHIIHSHIIHTHVSKLYNSKKSKDRQMCISVSQLVYTSQKVSLTIWNDTSLI